jgi:hypothetical protein
MAPELSPEIVAARLRELRALTPRPSLAELVTRRLAELRALDEMTRYFARARKAGLIPTGR